MLILPRHIILAVLLVMSACAAARAQEPLSGDLGEFYSYGDNYFLEVATMPSTNPTKARTVATFRLSYDLLTFRKTSLAYQKSSVYIATPTIYMEAVASDGVIVDRGSWRDTARVQDYGRTNSKSDFICGSIELALRPGLYTIKYTFDDGTPGAGFAQSTQPFAVDDFHSPSPAIGAPIFLRSAAADTLTLTSIDGAALFGRRLRVYVPLASATPPRSLRYEVAMAPRKGDTPHVVRSGTAAWIGAATIRSIVPAGDDVRMVVDRTVPDSSRMFAALIDCSTDELNVGDYLLTLTCSAGANSVTDSLRFKIRWVDMPFSLARPDYAVKVLYPIATDETIDEMLSGGREKQRLAVNAFWEPRDPTPGTKFNEAMDEYYRRVDYAYFNFRSIGQNDGAFTDRGKIYILYGPPAEVSRDLQPNAPPREVWLYRTAIHRRFVFTDDARSGEYRLVEYNDL